MARLGKHRARLELDDTGIAAVMQDMVPPTHHRMACQENI